MRYLVAVAVLFMAVGCGGEPENMPGDAGGNDSVAATDGGSSPEDVFNKMQEGFKQGDYDVVFSCIAPEDHDNMLFGAQIALAITSMANPDMKTELEGVFKKHGVNTDKKGPVNLNDEAAMNEAIAQMFKDVKDKTALFQDLMQTGAKLGGDQFSIVPKDAHLKDIKIDGDVATAVIVTDGREQPGRFVKKNGRWYASMKMTPPK